MTSYNIEIDKRLFLRDKIIEGSRKYKNKLMNKSIFIICEDGTSYTVRFFANDFLHLTGIHTNLDEGRFFENSSLGFLSEGNIDEKQKYNWQTLKSKAIRIQNIDEIIYTDVNDSLFMENLHTNTYTYPVAIRNTTQNTCIGFKDDINKARTLRKSTNSTNADSQKKILAIFSKPPGQALYGELIYISDVTVLLSKKPNVTGLLSDNILEKINIKKDTE